MSLTVLLTGLMGVALLALAPAIPSVYAQDLETVTTIAGGGSDDYVGPPVSCPPCGWPDEETGPATDARIVKPSDAVTDRFGNVYIAEAGTRSLNGGAAGPGARIRKVDPHGEITTIAGTGGPGVIMCCSWTPAGDNGPAKSAGFTLLGGLALDSSDNLYMADGQSVRYINLGPTETRPCGLTTPVQPGYIVSCAGTGERSDTGDGMAGGPGPATSATFREPTAVAVDAGGNVFIADSNNYAIKRVDAQTGIITRVVGNGRGQSGDNVPVTGPQSHTRKIGAPTDLEVDPDGNIYIATPEYFKVRMVDANGILRAFAGDFNKRTYSGDGGVATQAGLPAPYSVELDRKGGLLIADAVDNRVRRVDLSSRLISTMAGDGVAGVSPDGTPAASAHLNTPVGLDVDPSGRDLLITNFGDSTNPDSGEFGRILGILTKPIISTMTPPFGPVTGNQPFTVQGDLLENTVVTFGGVPGTGLITAKTSIAGVTPPHLPPGPVPVAVSTRRGGTADVVPTFTYYPALTALSRPSGRPEGGDSLTIYGQGFTAISQVRVTTTPETIIPISAVALDTEVTITTPPHPQGGEVRIYVTAYGLESMAVPAEANIFTYRDPRPADLSGGKNNGGPPPEDGVSSTSLSGPGAGTGGGFGLAPGSAAAPAGLGSNSSAFVSGSVPAAGSAQALDPSSAASSSGASVATSPTSGAAGSPAQMPQARMQLGVRPVIAEIPDPDERAAERYSMVARDPSSASALGWGIALIMLTGCFVPAFSTKGKIQEFQAQRA